MAMPTRERTGYSLRRGRPLEDIRKHVHVLTPGRYVGTFAVRDDGEPFDKKMERLTAQLR
jgi:type I restriction enzyme M protein